MTELETRLINHTEQDRYRNAGWEIDDLGHHNAYKVLAVKKHPPPVFLHKLCTDGVLTVTIEGETYVKQLDAKSLSALLADGAQALSLMLRDEP